jgi:hypothetical protein
LEGWLTVTFVTAPDIIELADFTGGFAPDGVTEHDVPNALMDVLNLVVDPTSGALVMRRGFRQVDTEGDMASDHGERYVKAIGGVAARYTSANNTLHNFYIIVTTTGAAGANNVKIYAVDTADGNSVQRIDDAGVEWDNPDCDHWLIPIDNKMYGGSRDNPMWSWDGDDGYDSTISSTAGNYKAFVDDVNDAVSTATEYARDFAWKGNEKTTYIGNTYSPHGTNRYRLWQDDVNRYVKGDLVSHKAGWGTTTAYYKSFRCIKANDPSVAAHEPGIGANWTTFWKKLSLGPPADADGDTAEGWDLITDAAQTKVACFWADRLWLRFDGHGRSRMQFSAPTKPQKDAVVPLTVFDPADWAPGGDDKGPGGGWIPVNDGRQAGDITACRGFGQYQLVWHQTKTHVITGWSEETFQTRLISDSVGCVSAKAHAEKDGITYFLSKDGLYSFDGTDARAVGGNEGVKDFLQDRINLMDFTDTEGPTPSLFRAHDFIGIALPAPVEYDGDNPYVTLFYHPQTQSFWRTDLPVYTVLERPDAAEDEDFFFGAGFPFETSAPHFYRFSSEVYDDVDDDGSEGVSIAWSFKTMWWPFGMRREERRIRRLWALIQAPVAEDVTVSQFRNYDSETVAATVDRTPSGDGVFSYIEGVTMADSYAVQFEFSGESTEQVKVSGVAVDTEPRRVRYHS